MIVTYSKYNEKKEEYQFKTKKLNDISEDEAIEEAIKLSIKYRKATLETPEKYIICRDGIIYKEKEKIEAPVGGNNFKVEAEVIEDGKTYQFRRYINTREVKQLGGTYAIWCSDGRMRFCKNDIIRCRCYPKFVREGNII